jgi:hypothetical protein
MDRRLFLTGLLGVAGTAALATAMPREAGAAWGDPLDDLRPPRPDENLPEWEVAETPVEEGDQYAWHRGHPHRGHRRRRRRRRYRRWRRRCYWRHGIRRCRRVPYWIWGWY